MKTWRFAPDYVRILSYLSQGWGVTKIAQSFGVNHSVISGKIGKLVAHGFLFSPIRSFGNIYPLSPLGNEVLALFNQLGGNPDAGILQKVSDMVSSCESFTGKIRMHRVILKYQLKDRLPKDFYSHMVTFRDYPVKTKELTNHKVVLVDLQDFNALVTGTSLIISGLQVPLSAARSIEEQAIEVLASLQDEVEKVENRLHEVIPSLKIRRLDKNVLDGKIMSMEFAFENHPVSEFLESRNHHLLSKYPADGKLRIITDKSNGSGELETVHPALSLQDMENLRKGTAFMAEHDLEQIITQMLSEIQREGALNVALRNQTVKTNSRVRELSRLLRRCH